MHEPQRAPGDDGPDTGGSPEKPDAAPQDRRPLTPPQADGDAVDEMEQESFPASDPPSTWAGSPPPD